MISHSPMTSVSGSWHFMPRSPRYSGVHTSKLEIKRYHSNNNEKLIISTTGVLLWQLCIPVSFQSVQKKDNYLFTSVVKWTVNVGPATDKEVADTADILPLITITHMIGSVSCMQEEWPLPGFVWTQLGHACRGQGWPAVYTMSSHSSAVNHSYHFVIKGGQILETLIKIIQSGSFQK